MKFFITMRQINLEKKSEPFAERSHQEAIIEQLSLQNRKTCLRVRKDIQQRKVARRNTKNGGLKSAFKASKEAVYTSILQWLLSNETYPDFTPYFLSFHAKSNSQKQRPKKSSSILKKKKNSKRHIYFFFPFKIFYSQKFVIIIITSTRLASFKYNFLTKNAQDTWFLLI